MYTGAALIFGLIRACRGGLVLYCSVLSDAGGENDGSSAIFERSLLGWAWRTTWSTIMVTWSNGNISRVTGSLWGESTGERWIPLTKASDVELWYFLWSAPEQRLSKQSRSRGLETPSSSLWRHCHCNLMGTKLRGWHAARFTHRLTELRIQPCANHPYCKHGLT